MRPRSSTLPAWAKPSTSVESSVPRIVSMSDLKPLVLARTSISRGSIGSSIAFALHKGGEFGAAERGRGGVFRGLENHREFGGRRGPEGVGPPAEQARHE